MLSFPLSHHRDQWLDGMRTHATEIGADDLALPVESSITSKDGRKLQTVTAMGVPEAEVG